MKQLYDILEGLLDDEWDIDDSSVGAVNVKSQIKDLMALSKDKPDDPIVEKTFLEIKESVQLLAAENMNHKKSVMLRLRSKESTAVIFKEISNERAPYKYEIEIRRFIKNPRPDVFEIKFERPTDYLPNGRLVIGWQHKTNHISQLSPQIAKNVCFIDDDAFQEFIDFKNSL